MPWLLIIVVTRAGDPVVTAPDGPLAGVLNALTFRFLAPIRRADPPLGGTLDLSPLILIVAVQLLLMLPVRWLELAVLQVFR
ncbi:MAG: YggT family protein [Betaproteobacteria bacterium]|nr:YggT family protein [Betaproteobacteria bacterium]